MLLGAAGSAKGEGRAAGEDHVNGPIVIPAWLCTVQTHHGM
jgi:hypothetical protein